MRVLQSTSGTSRVPATRLGELGRSLVEGMAFWAAVLLPFCAIILLAARSAPASITPAVPSWPLLTAVLAANVLALLVGHRHRRTD